MDSNLLNYIDRVKLTDGVLVQYIDTNTDSTIFLLENNNKQLEICTVDLNGYMHVHTATDRDVS